MEERRIMQMTMAGDFLLQIWEEGLHSWRIAAPGVPDDAQILAGSYAASTDTVTLTIESGRFDPVPVGVPIPELPPLSIEVTEERAKPQR